jgi:PKD repeat protein
LIAPFCIAAWSASPVAADVPIYADGLADGWVDWSWKTTCDFSYTSDVHSGAHSLSVTFTDGWAGLYLHADTPIDTSNYEQLRFWIKSDKTGNSYLRVVANGDDSKTFAVNTQAATWTEVNVPLSSLGSPASLSDLYWQDTTGNAQSPFRLDDISLVGGTVPPTPALSLSIDAGAERHPIRPGIYGMNFADEQLASDLRLSVRRRGGNSTSRYNWQNDTYNTGSDWYFENIREDTPDSSALPDGSAADLFVEQDRRTGAKTILTVPLIGWTAKRRVETHPYDCGFKVSKYGAQQSTDPWDTNCGNGKDTSGKIITGNDPADTSTAVTPSFVSGWIGHLTSKYGVASNGGVAYYNLDNEPMLWNETHRDVHPTPVSYDELRGRTYQYGAAIKSADPSAQTLGPVLWGWCAYYYSAVDGCGAGTDYNTHGDLPFVPWYLREMKVYEDLNRTRILDYLDLHYYPAAAGVSLSAAGNASTQARRLRSTRSLWDPTYIDESWISDLAEGGIAVQLIPRMKNWVNDHYPGTGLAITEYNWGGLEHINGALTQADVLGIFGREGLDLATLWAPPTSGQPGAFAFRMYRNYDGAGNSFGDTSVKAASTDQGVLSVYAAQRRTDNALTVVVINKSAESKTVTVSLAGFSPLPAATAYRYSPATPGAIEHVDNQPVTSQGFEASFPANSITLFVLMPANPDTFTLDISKAGTGGGTVVPNGGTITWVGNSGYAAYGRDALVSLTATGDSDSTFTGWSGECGGNSNPCVLTMTSGKTVSAAFALKSGFTATPSTGQAPLYVNFTDTSIHDPVSWSWDFGDGAGSTARNPGHLYKLPGKYSVSLTADGAGGPVTATKGNYITISACSNDPVRNREKGTTYTTIQNGYDNAATGDVIMLQALDFTEDLDLKSNYSVSLQGGYACGYSAIPAPAAIHGSLIVRDGSVTVDTIAIW